MLVRDSVEALKETLEEPSESYRLTYGMALSVWAQLGAGHDEAVYRNALVVALQSKGKNARQEVSVPVEYDGYWVGAGRADIVFNNVVIELKTVSKLNDAHRAQIKAYMRGLLPKFDAMEGVLVNFPSDDAPFPEAEYIGRMRAARNVPGFVWERR